MRPLAILGGTFDPVHVGHLRVAWEAADALDAEVKLVPANVPPHRPQPVATPAQRVAILEAALAGQSRLGLDLRELARSGPSYTIDTLAELRAEIGARPLVLLIGADAYGHLPTWHRWHDLFGYAHIGVLTRGGVHATVPDELVTEVAGRRAMDVADIRTTAAGHVIDLPVTALAISATRIRTLLSAGAEPRWLVPDALLADPALLAPYRVARQESTSGTTRRNHP
ncbi:nicotinate-nucleotide adenylyltransferase [Dokdonella sp.]|uniref:nicotinate-nucleotide adenylyltransferase n=1 Tax=Dokdonella sp. TaxID=2291710 RepID=UPI0025C24418|nr:nicotinate-nucleotide adenylyltransferase [Dokdonella sp.]MBX3692893.1 nicotinate-nucleotide adenylyltransferase [Dokdonella sp.]MCW5566824.1 nicotinate-nucleotide adenylyltransferase [Dokdonella sp.]